MKRYSAAWLVLFIQLVLLALFIRELSIPQWTGDETNTLIVGQTDSPAPSAGSTENRLKVFEVQKGPFERNK